MTGKAQCRWPKPLQVVAIFAAVQMRRFGKLSGMFIGVAVGAELKLDLVDRDDVCLWKVAPGAGYRCVLACEWIAGRGMFRQSEGGGLEPVDGVAH